MRRVKSYLSYGLLSLLLLLLCNAQSTLPRKEVWITRGTSQEELARFSAEIADTPETWERGLMERTSLAPNAGMLFLFPEVAPRAFWMMHTLIPLDILFIGADRQIINIVENAVPCLPPRQCPTYHSTAPAQYVLEIPGGRARALALKTGDRVHF